jgi:putative ABC transport system permease protein
MRSIIRSADPDQTISEIRSMDQIANERVSTFRVISQTVGLLSGFGLALAAFGIFSMVSYMVGERISEIGIRMAFGAKRGDICRMILQRGLALIASGLVLGLAAALATMPFLNNFLFGVTPRDFVSYSGSALIIIASGAFAMFIPVRRAISVDPMISIRHE